MCRARASCQVCPRILRSSSVWLQTSPSMVSLLFFGPPSTHVTVAACHTSKGHAVYSPVSPERLLVNLGCMTNPRGVRLVEGAGSSRIWLYLKPLLLSIPRSSFFTEFAPAPAEPLSPQSYPHHYIYTALYRWKNHRGENKRILENNVACFSW